VRLEDETDRKNADSVINAASEANRNLFREMIQEGGQMCEELKELLAPEIVEYKIRLADNAVKLADKDTEITKLKKCWQRQASRLRNCRAKTSGKMKTQKASNFLRQAESVPWTPW